eukprot:COSAG06_NODE_44875_length_359_cov_1.315385_1_plen_89_part_00
MRVCVWVDVRAFVSLSLSLCVCVCVCRTLAAFERGGWRDVRINQELVAQAHGRDLLKNLTDIQTDRQTDRQTAPVKKWFNSHSQGGCQ